MFNWFRNRRRKTIRSKPFPPGWTDIIEANSHYFDILPESLRDELRGHVQVFLAEKHFEGCGGFEITDEVRVIVATQACMLLLNRETDLFPRLKTILVYESAFFAEQEERGEDGLISLSRDAHAGESWNIGVVILAWDEVNKSFRHKHDGYNVVIHEFAHQLDSEDKDTDGVPVLDGRGFYQRWQEVFSEHYKQLLKDVKRRRKTVLDDYGATNPAEFFAVATESFFEESILLKTRHPDLYEVLSQYYQQDPAQYWEDAKN